MVVVLDGDGVGFDGKECGVFDDVSDAVHCDLAGAGGEDGLGAAVGFDDGAHEFEIERWGRLHFRGWWRRWVVERSTEGAVPAEFTEGGQGRDAGGGFGVEVS